MVILLAKMVKMKKVKPRRIIIIFLNDEKKGETLNES
jgi:hypothetical protein